MVYPLFTTELKAEELIHPSFKWRRIIGITWCPLKNMLAYDHGWEELEAEDPHAVVPIPTSPELKEIAVSHYHSKKACTLQ